MANQMIALGVRAPQGVDFGGAATRYSNMMAQRAQMEAFKQDAASKQMEREQKRALSAAYASSINPQTGEIDQAALIRNLQSSGLGNAIPGALEDIGKAGKSRADAKTSDLAYYKSFNDTAIEELTSALSPEQAIAAGARLKARFPDLGANIDELVQTIPQDPALYDPWRQEQLFHSMEADKQIEYTKTKAKDENMPGANGEVLTVRTGSERPVEGVIQQNILAPRGGTGGPYEVAPAAAMSRGGGATPRANEAIATLAATNNDAEYQTALAMLERQNPQAAAQVRAIMPRFNPQQMQGLRNAAMAASASSPRMAGNPPMVAGPRGGPDEGMPMRASSTQDGMVSNFGQPEYVSTGRPAYTRIPAPPQGPQPRETPAEAAAKARAVKQVEFEAEQGKSATDQQRVAKNFFKVIGVDPRSGRDPVAELIKKSTSGAVEAVGAELMGALPSDFGGGATPGAEAIGELQTIAAKLTNDLLGGKLGTGISNEDRRMIERLVGDIANPYIAAGQRLASWRRVKQIQQSYLGANPSAPAARKNAAPKGGWGKATVVGN